MSSRRGTLTILNVTLSSTNNNSNETAAVVGHVFPIFHYGVDEPAILETQQAYAFVLGLLALFILLLFCTCAMRNTINKCLKVNQQLPQNVLRRGSSIVEQLHVDSINRINSLLVAPLGGVQFDGPESLPRGIKANNSSSPLPMLTKSSSTYLSLTEGQNQGHGGQDGGLNVSKNLMRIMRDIQNKNLNKSQLKERKNTFENKEIVVTMENQPDKVETNNGSTSLASVKFSTPLKPAKRFTRRLPPIPPPSTTIMVTSPDGAVRDVFDYDKIGYDDEGKGRSNIKMTLETKHSASVGFSLPSKRKGDKRGRGQNKNIKGRSKSRSRSRSPGIKFSVSNKY